MVLLAAIAIAVALTVAAPPGTVIAPDPVDGFTDYHSWNSLIGSLSKVSRLDSRLVFPRSTFEHGPFARVLYFGA
ncbi:hypothetical protein ACIQUM_33135 [Amycolatopsis azurea]|uniref:hypothetical protein n=1 Tax=Amycolatopsis azurea TaxID=36819 RepID=UPI00382D450E